MDEKTVEFMGNLGDSVGGFSTFVLAIIAIVAVPSVWRDLRARLKAQQELAEEQARDIRLERDRNFYGWMPGALSVYRVENVSTQTEIEQAAAELTAGGPSAYVILKVENSENRANHLRQLVETDGSLAKPPTKKERDILERAKPTPPQRVPGSSV